MAPFKRHELLVGAVAALQMVGLFVALRIFSNSMDKTAGDLEQLLAGSGATPA